MSVPPRPSAGRQKPPASTTAAGKGLDARAGRPPTPKKRPQQPRFDRERFIFKLLAVVILVQLTLYSTATVVCGQVAVANRRRLAEVCPRALDQVSASFDSTLKLLVALLGGAALEHTRR
ncbi:hypothetical protein [Synechococcus sp. EJ6-Ellesmere]|uniref:hypothetical protein n=1 Tax=Synechococcus sp. EJ6-Ellesmere TaxID=2823734 RepID=UPI0020CEC958|nr:hypothetical protein [Synechococcus sp. EJ6-Ellesmere]MCP9826110.1 hypothetical protein [Synechococcus sp. EJ6-Ellesmere]